jgi:pimeloyl-ACP methyl ester carboxylesterase
VIVMLETVTSPDGTRIAFERSGDGPPVVLVGGAFNDRTTVAGLAAALASSFTGVAYDRRGRGDSTDNDTYTAQREIDDIAALISHVGGTAHVFGHSSGASLALEATRQDIGVDKLVVYEPPFVVDDSRPRPGADIADRLRALVTEGRRDDAVKLFLTESVSVPTAMVESMRAGPVWAWLANLAHTLPYDATVCTPGLVLPADRLATITAPTLAIAGSNSPPWILAAARAVADAIPKARYITLQGQDHSSLQHPEALAPVLTGFLA